MTYQEAVDGLCARLANAIKYRDESRTSPEGLAGAVKRELMSPPFCIPPEQIAKAQAEMDGLKWAPKYAIGDLVMLKSTGPVMTVQEVNKVYHLNDDSTVIEQVSIDTDTPVYFCTWFDGAKLQDGIFPEATLMPGLANPDTLT